ncbi:hypothetical protein QQ045_019418 [Rhodiola kirilowii]
MEVKIKKDRWEKLTFQVWSGLAPPKVELIVWKIYQESLPSKDLLAKRRVLNREEDLKCQFCGSELETTNHLLLHCRWSWKVWSWCIKWWGVSWVSPPSMKILLQSWGIARVSKTHKRFWKTLSYTVIWTIWEERNKRCFLNQRKSIEEIGDLIKMRISWWVKFRNSGSPYSIDTIGRCIEEVTRD